jgi:hypothetical protein
MPWSVAAGIGSFIFGWVSSYFRSIRAPLLVSFVLYTAGTVGWATIQPGQGFHALAFAALAGLGFSGPLILITAGVQLYSPHSLIATSTSVVVSSRAVGAAIFTAIYVAAFQAQLKIHVPNDVVKVAVQAGLPAQSIGPFVAGISSNNITSIDALPGVTAAVIAAGHSAFNQAFADSLRVIFIISAAFGLLGCILCFGVSDVRLGMNYKVEAPMEELHASHHETKRRG